MGEEQLFFLQEAPSQHHQTQFNSSLLIPICSGSVCAIVSSRDH